MKISHFTVIGNDVTLWLSEVRLRDCSLKNEDHKGRRASEMSSNSTSGNRPWPHRRWPGSDNGKAVIFLIKSSSLSPVSRCPTTFNVSSRSNFLASKVGSYLWLRDQELKTVTVVVGLPFGFETFFFHHNMEEMKMWVALFQHEITSSVSKNRLKNEACIGDALVRHLSERRRLWLWEGLINQCDPSRFLLYKDRSYRWGTRPILRPSHKQNRTACWPVDLLTSFLQMSSIEHKDVSLNIMETLRVTFNRPCWHCGEFLMQKRFFLFQCQN